MTSIVGRYICILLISLCLAFQARADDNAPLNRFEYWPDDQSPLTENGKAQIKSYLEKNGSSSFLIIRKGKIAFEYGDIHKKHLIHSMRKPIMSLLYGRAVEKGQIDLEETVASLDLDETGVAFTDTEKSATVADLLKARSGIYLPAAAETSEMAAARPKRGLHQPGEQYFYNNWSFNSVGSVFEAKTGIRIYDAFHEQLAKPLGMTSYQHNIGNFSVVSNEDDLEMDGLDGFYLLEAENSRHPAYHFRLSAHDLALIGQLIVQDGNWNSEQLVPSEWLEKSTQCYSVINENIGGGRSLCYGMMWELVRQSDNRITAFSHTGLGVHMIYVYPAAELVLVHRVDTEGEYHFPSGGTPALIGMTFGAFKR
ncbi:serine hydrolase [Kordiimonas sp. SCSIO 12610]|uniref:serine hydrolase domain-containing protein n=1 Tax=Kordiimonas sp. SCSIO 12610 TaxID=2829597 RepID=UPI00210E3F31|nr:serine hydrolase [Kordiimonas sp. SCSIO 12610]UTW56063.1 serine hydrolase [Kordiimonas sp. SCSIO 12610]